MQEFDKQQSKLDKIQSRKGTQTQPGAQAKLDLVLLQPSCFERVDVYICVCLLQTQRSVASAKADYERVHSRLMHDIPQLLDNRLGYFDQCLQAVIKAQVRQSRMFAAQF